MNDKDLTYRDLTTVIEERSKEILESFGQVAISGVTHSGLLSILGDIKAYWKDAFRPALTSFSCEAVGGQPGAADVVGLMITVVGAGLGIHDDIIDKSLNKHFRMTIPGLHGFDDALLVGDLLIIKSWATIQRMISGTCQLDKIANVIEAYESFFVEVCEAELMEISCRRKVETELEYDQKILWKSTADTEACARLGAILGDGSKDEIEALAEFGRRLGFTFRLMDDVKDSLNVEGNLPHRLEHESVPLPILYAAKSSKERLLRINSILQKSPITALDIGELVRFCFETEAFTYVYEIAEQNEMEASRKLSLLKPSTARKMLSLMSRKSLADIASICR